MINKKILDHYLKIFVQDDLFETCEEQIDEPLDELAIQLIFTANTRNLNTHKSYARAAIEFPS